MNTPQPLLTVENLTVDFHAASGAFRAVDDVTFHVDSGETLVILGESGSGKSVSASAVMGLIDTPPGEIVSGRISYRGTDVTRMSEDKRLAFNGSKVAIIFQDPLSHLNPVYTVGWQLAETYEVHGKARGAEARRLSIEALRRVGIPDPESRIDWYPHQFSGGQRQRIMIGMAIALGPELLIADEPTTALDVSVQAQILDLLKELQREEGLAIVMITHDLEVAANMADRVIVMNAGKIVEQGIAKDVFADPQHAYTKRLMSALPDEADYRDGKSSGESEPILEVRDLSKTFLLSPGLLRPPKSLRAVDSVNFDLKAGETLGIVGESGSGKSTIAKMLLRLTDATSGEALFHGKDIFRMNPKELMKFRRRVQMVFQDPFSSMNPRMSVFSIISEPWSIHSDILEKSRWRERVIELLGLVGLRAEHADRFPHQFSGGQRQRIAIARALACDPELIICDEAVSALDVSIQMQIIDLLADLRDRLGLAYIFITHDLPIVRGFADRILVMQSGQTVELQRTEEIFRRPQRPYTQMLINASPRPKWEQSNAAHA
ncbi:peptide/nickel transport system ATP-binding protein [Palleronia marisminoris]|uniref:Glutathione import ATP-binding protein GsiA n=1 Tax=Palleronia marisminoris TaxID=315423 RepID=A0A1Y5SPQ1_9RHOB|nr:ABC transporter ATP-binding protein [Palleronia marisminoris]SFG92908.1 peptide/nickel transport system ATP-binding protein [Palleronia marisminoris]SLN44964.1 Glutathione import ATP-binding protein GsiA [Palleronia marisminoris]